jgi:hypothetical protein
MRQIKKRNAGAWSIGAVDARNSSKKFREIAMETGHIWLAKGTREIPKSGV